MLGDTSFKWSTDSCYDSNAVNFRFSKYDRQALFWSIIFAIIFCAVFELSAPLHFTILKELLLLTLMCPGFVVWLCDRGYSLYKNSNHLTVPLRSAGQMLAV